jgi:nucleoside 2-deoxyribosyltransferase
MTSMQKSQQSRTYTVYTAGSLFTQHDLSTNVYLKKAVWERSDGLFELVLPQTKELRNLQKGDIAAYVRNQDLNHVVRADLVLARFDGVELDAGTVVEYIVAKILGKPAVILRTDTRHLTSKSFDAPYNLMVKNWPRTKEVRIDSLMQYVSQINHHEKISKSFPNVLAMEINAIRQGIESLAEELISAFQEVILLPSPYPVEYQELIYHCLRYSPGGDFHHTLTENEIEMILHRLKANGTL